MLRNYAWSERTFDVYLCSAREDRWICHQLLLPQLRAKHAQKAGPRGSYSLTLAWSSLPPGGRSLERCSTSGCSCFVNADKEYPEGGRWSFRVLKLALEDAEASRACNTLTKAVE